MTTSESQVFTDPAAWSSPATPGAQALPSTGEDEESAKE